MNPSGREDITQSTKKTLLFLSSLKADSDGTCVFLMGTLPPLNLLLSLTLAKVTRSPETEQFHVELLRFVQLSSHSAERSRSAVAPAAQGQGTLGSVLLPELTFLGEQVMPTRQRKGQRRGRQSERGTERNPSPELSPLQTRKNTPGKKL